MLRKRPAGWLLSKTASVSLLSPDRGVSGTGVRQDLHGFGAYRVNRLGGSYSGVEPANRDHAPAVVRSNSRRPMTTAARSRTGSQ